MKLVTPPITIDPENPFAQDLFHRQDFALALQRLVHSAEDNLVIYVNAPWGAGKTTFCRMWQASLAKEGKKTICFDAYATDYVEDPFVCFAGEISDFVRKNFLVTGSIQKEEEFRNAAIDVAKKIGVMGAKVAIKALTLNIVGSDELKAIESIKEDIADGVADVTEKVIEEKIDNYAAEKASLAKFKETLRRVAKMVREEQHFPLTIIVDELDRCRPDYALRLLERMKHLFDVENVVFVLLVNREQIEGYIDKVYGASTKARDYLLKFAHVSTDFPISREQPRETQIEKFCERLIDHHSLKNSHAQRIDHLRLAIVWYAMHFGLTLREVERTFTLMALYYASLPKGSYTDEVIVPFLAVIKLRHPIIFAGLEERTVDYDELNRVTKIEQIESQKGRGLSKDWLIRTLRYFLLSKEAFEKLPDDDPSKNTEGHYLRIFNSRSDTVPYLCRMMSLFKPLQ